MSGVHIKVMHTYRNLHLYASFRLCIHRAEVYLGPYQTFMMELLAVNNFGKKVHDNVSNTPLQDKLWRDCILEKII